MDALDALIAKHMTARLLDRKRLKIILTQILERQRKRIARDGDDRLEELTRRGEEVRLRLKRLLKTIEIGALSLDEPALQERLAYLRALQARTEKEIRSLQAELNHAGTLAMSPSLVCGVIKAAEQRLMERGHGFRRSYLSVFAKHIIAEAGKVQIVRARQIRAVALRSHVGRSLWCDNCPKADIDKAAPRGTLRY